jgi:hypothetical protein
VYAAMDALAARATAWAERRQRLLLEANPADDSLQSPADAGAAAAEAVRNVSHFVSAICYALHGCHCTLGQECSFVSPYCLRMSSLSSDAARATLGV